MMSRSDEGTIKSSDGSAAHAGAGGPSDEAAATDGIEISRASEVNSSFRYSEHKWIVSALNTGDKTGGHAIVVVEGLKKPNAAPTSSMFVPPLEIFIGQYDIGAMTEDEPAPGIVGTLNTKGYITSIKCREGNTVTKPGGYKSLPSRSYCVDAENARLMIASIKDDEITCKRAQRREIPYPPYQYLGTDHPLVRLFGSTKDGHSCASWAAEKISIATGSKHSGAKPKFVAGQCAIL